MKNLNLNSRIKKTEEVLETSPSINKADEIIIKNQLAIMQGLITIIQEMEDEKCKQNS